MARPIFSAPSRGNKVCPQVRAAIRIAERTTLHLQQLVQRFMLPQRFVVASCYHRIMYTPAPVLVFRPRPGTHTSLHPCRPVLNHRCSVEPNQPQPLLAAGSLMEANPNRLLIKRIVLTGHPVHCMRRFAVVRFMFFNADDIRWFKPVEVWTKHGAPAPPSGHRGRCQQVTCLSRSFV